MTRLPTIQCLITVAVVCSVIVGCSITKVDETTSQDNSQQKPQSDAQRTDIDSGKAAIPPHLRFSPSVLVTTPDSAGFVTARIYIHNDGGGTLTMTEVKGSCGCAGASVQRNKISGSDSGMIYLQINSKSFTEATNNVDFTVKSNADNSPTVFRAVINTRR